MQYEIKYTNIEHLQGGSFMCHEEDAAQLGFSCGEMGVLLPVKEFEKIQSVFQLIRDDESGDFEFVKYQIKKIMEGKN